jgi:hypothetical protein
MLLAHSVFIYLPCNTTNKHRYNVRTLCVYIFDIYVSESSCGYLSCDFDKLSTFRVDFTLYVSILAYIP